MRKFVLLFLAVLATQKDASLIVSDVNAMNANLIFCGSDNASDWIMMRREEMVLIEAEGLAMSNDLAGGKNVLEMWMKANRDASYASAATTAEEFQCSGGRPGCRS